MSDLSKRQNAHSPTCQASALIEETDFGRQAAQIADGSISFPEGLSEHETQELLATVQALQRTRLVRFIARQIAVSIHQLREQERTKNAENDQI